MEGHPVRYFLNIYNYQYIQYRNDCNFTMNNKNMKSTKIVYWIFTILLVVLMLFSAVASLRPNQNGIALMKHIRYP